VFTVNAAQQGDSGVPFGPLIVVVGKVQQHIGVAWLIPPAPARQVFSAQMVHVAQYICTMFWQDCRMLAI
jgi:hypothetical protein